MGSLAQLSPLPERGVKRMRPDHRHAPSLGTSDSFPGPAHQQRKEKATGSHRGPAWDPQPLWLVVSCEVSPPASELSSHQCCRCCTQSPPGSCLTGSIITTHSFNKPSSASALCQALWPTGWRGEAGWREVRGSKAAKEANTAGAGVPRPAAGLRKASRSPHTCSETLREPGWAA